MVQICSALKRTGMQTDGGLDESLMLFFFIYADMQKEMKTITLGQNTAGHPRETSVVLSTFSRILIG